jgi:hypothetical protein
MTKSAVQGLFEVGGVPGTWRVPKDKAGTVVGT